MLASLFLSLAVFQVASTSTQESPPAEPVSSKEIVAVESDEITADARMIVDRYINATGGKAGWSSVKAIQGNGTLDIPAAGITGTAAYVVTPDLYRNTFRMTGGPIQDASIITGRNGDVVWQLSGENEQYTGKLIEGAERLRNLRQYQFNQMLDLEKNFLRVELVDIEEIEGSRAFKILMVPRESPQSKEYRFFDQESNLIVKTMVDDGTGRVQEAYFDSYKQFGPVKLHTRTRRMTGGQVLMTIATPEILINKPVPKSFEEMPLEIKVLLGEKKVSPPVTKPE